MCFSTTDSNTKKFKFKVMSYYGFTWFGFKEYLNEKGKTFYLDKDGIYQEHSIINWYHFKNKWYQKEYFLIQTHNKYNKRLFEYVVNKKNVHKVLRGTWKQIESN